MGHRSHRVPGLQPFRLGRVAAGRGGPGTPGPSARGKGAGGGGDFSGGEWNMTCIFLYLGDIWG